MTKKILAIFIFTFLFSLSNPYSITLAQGRCVANHDRAEDKCELILNECEESYSPKIGSSPICLCNCESGIRNPVITDKLSELSGSEFLNKLISFGISIGFGVAAVTFFLMFIMGGIKWITSQGDKARVEQARSQITHALIGLLLTFFLFVILKLLEDFFGISLTHFNLPKLTD